MAWKFVTGLVKVVLNFIFKVIFTVDVWVCEGLE